LENYFGLKKIDINKFQFVDFRRMGRGCEYLPYAKEVIERLGSKYELVICSIGTLDNISLKAKWIKNNLLVYTSTISTSYQ